MITDAASLRSHYRAPHPAVLKKSVPTVDEAAATFLAASPFFVLATASTDGADASPRGGPPGFVRVLEGGHRIAWADLAGNNRLDSFQNLVAQPSVGLLFFVPGLEETLRVNGRAALSTDPDVLEAVAFDAVRPKVAAVIEVSECYVHCAKAVRRAALWDPASRPAAPPSPAAIITEHLELDVDPALVAADLEAGYQHSIWLEGGDDPDA